MNRLLAILALFALLVLPMAGFAAGSNICSNDPCDSDEVGPLMDGISQACGNEGTCSLTDIQTVFANVGNWILGIVGAGVLLVYVVGGFYFLISGMPGMEKFREKGKAAIKMSTLGLVIVFIGYAGLSALKGILESGTLPTTGYISCGPGATNVGKPCGDNSVCSEAGTCITECAARHPAPTVEEIQAGTATGWDCVDTTIRTGLVCEEGYCPQGTNIQCCQVL
jgi:hypothetical protein